MSTTEQWQGKSVYSASRSYKRAGYELFVIQSSLLVRNPVVPPLSLSRGLCIKHWCRATGGWCNKKRYGTFGTYFTNIIVHPYQKVPVFICQILLSTYEHTD